MDRKFNLRDKVSVLDTEYEGRIYDVTYCYTNSEGHNIYCLDDKYSRLFDIDEDMLKLVENKSELKFAVGDRVKVTDYFKKKYNVHYNLLEICDGAILIVLRVNNILERYDVAVEKSVEDNPLYNEFMIKEIDLVAI